MKCSQNITGIPLESSPNNIYTTFIGVTFKYSKNTKIKVVTYSSNIPMVFLHYS